MTTAETAYNGETKPRKRWLAVLLTYLCPGLGYVYVGQLVKGLTLNLLFLLALEVFVIAFSVLKFFPILPFLVLVAGWLIFATLLAVDVRKQADEAGDDYVLKGYNHWTIYLVAYLVSFLVPVVLTLNFTTHRLWRLQTVHSSAMYPTIQSGDTVLTDLNAFHKDAPVRGEIVATTDPDGGSMEFLRIVGVHNDIVRMEGNTLYVNDEQVGRAPLKDDEITHAELDKDNGLLAWVEFNQGQRYVISVSPRVFSELTMPPTRLESDEYFLLADNRSQVPVHGEHTKIRDSRNFGKVKGDDLVGIPRYIFWSTAPDGSIRWDRIGLRVR